MELKETPNVCISAPIRNREWIVERYLQHIYNLNYPKKKIILYWLLNDSVDGTEKYLKQFQFKHKEEYRDIIIEKVKNKAVEYKRLVAKNPKFIKEHWEKVYTNLSNLRNIVVEKMVSLDIDYFFSVDSDILLNPDDLTNLLLDNKDIIAGVINNDQVFNYGKDIHEVACNILNFKDDGRVSPIKGWKDGEVFPVDVTGAVCLYKTNIFKDNPDLRYKYDSQGEDIGFFRIVREKGIKAYADSRVRPTHVMAEGLFQICANCTRECKKFKIMDGERTPEIVFCNNFAKKI